MLPLKVRRPGSNGNREVLHIPQSSKAGASQSDGLMSYPGHLLRLSYPFAEMLLVHSTTLLDSAKKCIVNLKKQATLFPEKLLKKEVKVYVDA